MDFKLLDFNNTIVASGHKSAYCLEDSEIYQTGSKVPCDPQYSCEVQGIPRGRSDLYANNLDCQWIDLTDEIKYGCWYVYRVCSNTLRRVLEYTFDNNCATLELYIPDIPSSSSTVLSYQEAIDRDNAMSFYPGCKA